MSPLKRDRIRKWFDGGLAAVDPYAVTHAALQDLEPPNGKLVVISVGKAAVAMATAACDALGDRIDSGLLVAKEGQLDEEVEGFRAIAAGHPIPNEHSLEAGEAALDLVNGLSGDDTVIALISGGGSSLMENPIEGISLMDMQVTTELLMYAGAEIYDLNTVRRALSAIKGGGLRSAIGDAQCITLMLSDVVGNDHSVIASGPTVPGPSTRGRAWQIIDDFKIQDQVPESVQLALTNDAPPFPSIDTSRDDRRVIAENATLVSAVEQAAREDGLRVWRVWENWRDSVEELAHQIVRECRDAPADSDVLVGGGEATSIVRGNGLGGRNTETALLVAMEFTNDDDWTVASLASDGDDGNSGAAGAIVDAGVIADETVASAALKISDSAGYLESMDALVVTGQTGTNVNDVYIAVRNAALAGEIT